MHLQSSLPKLSFQRKLKKMKNNNHFGNVHFGPSISDLSYINSLLASNFQLFSISPPVSTN